MTSVEIKIPHQDYPLVWFQANGLKMFLVIDPTQRVVELEVYDHSTYTVGGDCVWIQVCPWIHTQLLHKFLHEDHVQELMGKIIDHEDDEGLRRQLEDWLEQIPCFEQASSVLGEEYESCIFEVRELFDDHEVVTGAMLDAMAEEWTDVCHHHERYVLVEDVREFIDKIIEDDLDIEEVAS